MRHPNIALTEELTRAGWRPSRLAAALNQVLGEGYVSRSTVSEWLHAGRVPREPLPALVAQLLTEATGHPVSVRGLWPDAVLAPTWAVPADVGLAQIVAAPCPALALAHDWLRHADHQAGRDRRHFLPVSPSALPDGGHSTPTPSAASGVPSYVTADQTANQIAALPVSPAVLRFAHRQMLALAQALIDLPHERGLTSALVLATATAASSLSPSGSAGSLSATPPAAPSSQPSNRVDGQLSTCASTRSRAVVERLGDESLRRSVRYRRECTVPRSPPSP